MHPKVSVVIPTYNCAQYITEAIESVLNQTYKDIEIIVVDDGSTDNTKEILLTYIEEGLIQYIFQNNQGPGSARNTGIKESQGEFIAFLDADDTIESTSVNERVEMLKKYKEISLVFTDFFVLDNSKINCQREPILKKNHFLNKVRKVIKLIDQESVVFSKDFYYFYLRLSPRPICMPTVMLRKRCVEEYGLFDTTFEIGEDNEYWMRIIRNNYVGFINKPLGCYHHYRSYLTKNIELYAKDELRLQKQVFSRMIEDIKNQIKSSWYIKNIIGNSYFNLGYFYYKNNNFLESQKAIIKSIKYLNINIKTMKVLFLSIFRIPRDKLSFFVKNKDTSQKP